MSTEIQNMFDNISKKYDLMNTVLSFGIHYLWRKKAIKLANINNNSKVLDCATGTGDFAFEFEKSLNSNGKVCGMDFSRNMLEVAKKKSNHKNSSISFVQADALALPYKTNSFDLSSIGFGIRNVDDPVKGLSEMARVVKPGGTVLVLEFGKPKGIIEILYRVYSNYIMPFIGKLIAKDKFAYTYLPETAAKFPCRNGFIELMKKTDLLKNCTFHPLFWGIAFIYIGIVKEK